MVTSGSARRSMRFAASAASTLLPQCCRLAQRGRGKLHRQPIAGDGCLGRELHGSLRIEPLLDARLACRVRLRVFHYARYDPIAAARAGSVVGDAAEQPQPLISRADVEPLPRRFDRGQERLHPVLEHVEHTADVAALRIRADFDAHAVTVHETLHGLRRDEYRLGQHVAAHEAIAVTIGAQDSFDIADMAHRPARRAPRALTAQTDAAWGMTAPSAAGWF